MSFAGLYITDSTVCLWLRSVDLIKNNILWMLYVQTTKSLILFNYSITIYGHSCPVAFLNILTCPFSIIIACMLHVFKAKMTKKSLILPLNFSFWYYISPSTSNPHPPHTCMFRGNNSTRGRGSPVMQPFKRTTIIKSKSNILCAWVCWSSVTSCPRPMKLSLHKSDIKGGYLQTASTKHQMLCCDCVQSRGKLTWLSPDACSSAMFHWFIISCCVERVCVALDPRSLCGTKQSASGTIRIWWG